MISQLKLQRGSAISVGELCKVHPLLLDEISEIEEEKYNQYINILMIDKSTVNRDEISDEQYRNLTSYYVLVSYSHHDEMIRIMTEEALSIFLKEQVTYHSEGYFFIGEKSEQRIIDSNSYEEIKSVVRKQNYLQEKEVEKEFKPANDKAAEIIEKMKKAKEKMQKQNSDEGLNLSDIISIVANHSEDINILTVWNLTVYQLYECYLRLIMWDEYHTTNLHLPHMDEEARKSFKHWARKINL